MLQLSQGLMHHQLAGAGHGARRMAGRIGDIIRAAILLKKRFSVPVNILPGNLLFVM